MTLVEYVITNVNSESYYSKRFPKWNAKYRFNVYCPWHEKEGTNKPSLAINLRNGGAKCHGCGKPLGNIVHFESELKKISELDASKELYEEFVRPFFPKLKIDRYVANLQFEPKKLAQCLIELGLTTRTVKAFCLGYDFQSRRLIFPIRTRFNRWGNVRFYRFPSEREGDKAPKIYNATGYGYPELYPWDKIKQYDPEKPLVWMKAERDTLLAIQEGVQAFCITGSGESVGLERWATEFVDFEIFIVGDNDPEGIKHAQKRVDGIKDICKLAKVITLPFRNKGKDYSDWILKDGHSAKELLELIDEAKLDVVPVDDITDLKEAEYYSEKPIPLSEIKSNLEIRDVKVKTKGIIIGKLDRSYNLPYKFKVLHGDAPATYCEIPISRELIWMIYENDDKIKDFVRNRILKNKKAKLEAVDYLIATEVEIAPIVDISSEGTYLTYHGIFIGANPDTNVPYEFEIIPTTSIKTQQQVGIITSARPLSSILDSQIFQKENLEGLAIFKPDNDADTWEELCNFANEVSLQFTRIYNRLDWHLVALLTYLSPLYFKFPYEGIQRGWLNSLVIGDTQTGKSQVAHCLQRIFDCGAIVNAENCTFVGLVGGTLKNSTGQFMLRWGRIPINDRQLVVIEELSGLSTVEIARMSEVRSSGIARIDKGGITAETTARTRLMALSNVRGMGKALASYQSGLRAISELVGQAEDVSRFDLICTLTDSEVSSKVINQQALDYEEMGLYTADHLRRLVRFVWSLKPDQICLTEKAYLASLQITQEMAERYHPSVPIFKAGAGRLKLARIACAIACAQFNWNGKQINVEIKHIQCAEKLLQMLYDKESFGYRKYSIKAFARERITNEENLTRIFGDVFRKQEKRIRVLHYIESTGKFSDRELHEITGTPLIEISRFIGALIDSNVIERTGKEWQMTANGKFWLDKAGKV